MFALATMGPVGPLLGQRVELPGCESGWSN
jgi:hypothetical protein